MTALCSHTLYHRAVGSGPRWSNKQYFGVDMLFGGMPYEKVMRSMELFAKGVMPRFR